MNILNVATRIIGQIHPNKQVKLNRYEVIDSEWYPKYQLVESLETYAQIQPVSTRNTSNEILEAVDIKNVWIRGNKAEIVHFFKNATKTNTQIEIEGKLLQVYSIDDWSRAGFIKMEVAFNNEVAPLSMQIPKEEDCYCEEPIEEDSE